MCSPATQQPHLRCAAVLGGGRPVHQRWRQPPLPAAGVAGATRQRGAGRPALAPLHQHGGCHAAACAGCTCGCRGRGCLGQHQRGAADGQRHGGAACHVPWEAAARCASGCAGQPVGHRPLGPRLAQLLQCRQQGPGGSGDTGRAAVWLAAAGRRGRVGCTSVHCARCAAVRAGGGAANSGRRSGAAAVQWLGRQRERRQLRGR